MFKFLVIFNLGSKFTVLQLTTLCCTHAHSHRPPAVPGAALAQVGHALVAHTHNIV
jgi:hypothetical protein